jgi:hypothetical protein
LPWIRIHLAKDGIYLSLQGQRSHILLGCRESALLASREVPGAPLKAAAGRATTFKLQNKESKCWAMSFSMVRDAWKANASNAVAAFKIRWIADGLPLPLSARN